MLNKLLGRHLWEEDRLGRYRKGLFVFNHFIPLTFWKKRIVLQEKTR